MNQRGPRHSLLALAGLLVLQTGCMSEGSLLSGSRSLLPGSTHTANKEELAPDQAVRACLAVAQNLEKSGSEEAALQQYEKVLRLDPANLEASRRLAVLYDRQCEYAKADAEYQKLVTVRSRDADLFNDWGYSFYQRTRWKEAEERLRRALEIDPKHKRARSNLGLVLGQQGRYDEAFDCFKAVVGEADAHTNLAFVYWTQGRLDEARAECRQAQQIEPNNQKAQNVLAQLDRPVREQAEAPAASNPRSRRSREEVRVRQALATMGDANAQPAAGDVVQAGHQPEAGQPVYRSPSGTAWVPVTRANPPVAPAPMAPATSELVPPQ